MNSKVAELDVRTSSRASQEEEDCFVTVGFVGSGVGLGVLSGVLGSIGELVELGLGGGLGELGLVGLYGSYCRE